jgi:hypothetical protein
MATIHHQLAILALAAKVYEAISTADGIGTWWDKQTSMLTNRGVVLEHNPGPEHGVVKLRVVEQVPNKSVEWECISIHPHSSPASAWTGTHFIFEISELESTASAAERSCSGCTLDNYNTVDFRHTHYDEQSKFLGFNNFAWGQVLQNLKQVVESQSS